VVVVVITTEASEARDLDEEECGNSNSNASCLLFYTWVSNRVCQHVAYVTGHVRYVTIIFSHQPRTRGWDEEDVPPAEHAVRVLPLHNRVCVFWCTACAHRGLVRIIYGYSALKPVLVQEGVFEELCDGGGNATAASAAAAAAAAAAEEDGAVVCVPQSLQLDLMFTIGALSPLIGPLNGAVLDRFGPRVTLSSGGVLLVLACVLFAFADDQTFDVYIPAYLVMGVAGQMLVQTSMMLCSLVPKRAGLFMSMFNAAFDSSAFVFVVFQAIYTSTHGDIGVKQLFLGYMAVPVLLVLLVFFLAPPLSATKKAGEQQTSLELSTAASEQIEPAESSASLQDMRAPPVSLRKQLESGQFWWPPYIICFIYLLCYAQPKGSP